MFSSTLIALHPLGKLIFRILNQSKPIPHHRCPFLLDIIMTSLIAMAIVLVVILAGPLIQGGHHLSFPSKEFISDPLSYIISIISSSCVVTCTHVFSLPLALSLMSYFQALISQLTDLSFSSNTPSSSRSTTNSPFTIPYPSSLPNIHTRSPSRHSPSRQSTTSSQSPSTFHSLTRTLRSYVPSSIHIPIPSAAPSPPLVSRPVSFGRFSSDSRTDTINSGLGLGFGDATRGRKVVSRQEFERDYEREGEEEEYYAYGGHGYSYGYGQGHEQQQQSSTSGLARAMNQNRSPAPERAGGINVIEWAKWDVLGDR